MVEDAPWRTHVGAAVPGELPDPSTLLLLIFTSGSTSAPKAVRRSSGRIAAAASIGFSPDDAIYCAMPLIHGNALFGALMPALAQRRPHDPPRAVLGNRVAHRHPAVRRDLRDELSAAHSPMSLRRRRAASDKDHPLKVVLAPETSPRDAAAFTERFGVPVITGYGSSEAGITLLPSRRHGALGRAPEGTTIVVFEHRNRHGAIGRRHR